MEELLQMLVHLELPILAEVEVVEETIPPLTREGQEGRAVQVS